MTLLITFGILVATAYSRTITVGHDSRYDYQTITGAVGAAQPGDVILVAEGTYSESSGEVFPINLTPSITLRSAGITFVPVIQGSIHIKGEDVRTEGFKIIASSNRGIRIEDESTAEISRCLITGGGVYCSACTANFSNCTIRDNAEFGYGGGSFGGGVTCSTYNGPCQLAFRHCLITDNSATDVGFGYACAKGGGVYIDGVHNSESKVTFINCIIANNAAGAHALSDMRGWSWADAYGGGVYANVPARFVNCSFANNGVWAWAAYPSMNGDDVYAGSKEIINCIMSDDEPNFVDPHNGDYHLIDDSPCIDAGDPDPKWNDACRPPGKGTARNDMGAYGGPYNCGWHGQTSPRALFDFETGMQGWNFASRIALFNEPMSAWKEGLLRLSPAGSANCFSYWGSPEVYVDQGKTYRVRWTVSSSIGNPDEALDFRLRANELGNWRFWTTSITSLNDAAPTTQTKTYDLIILPETESTTDSVVLSFDLMGFNTQNDLQSWLYLDQVRLDEVSTTPTAPGVIPAHYSFENYTEGWEFQGKIGDFNEPVPVVLPGRIGLSPNGSPYCFSYWLSPEIKVEKDKVYLVSWQVSSSTNDPDKVVDFRLRCNQTSNLRAWDTGTFFSTSAAYPAAGEPRTYQLIIMPQMSTESDTVRLAFDVLSLDGANELNSFVYLEEVTMAECAIQP